MTETEAESRKPPLLGERRRGDGAGHRVPLLDFERSLVECVPEPRRDLARRALVVSVYELRSETWMAPEVDRTRSFGFLIGSGMVVRETRIDGSKSLEPLGPGDLVRPWMEEAASFAESDLRALTPARIAVLDREFALRAAKFPELIASLLDRALARSRYLAIYAAIDGLVGVKKRLVALMWTFAERWGELREGEIFLPVEFHHSALAYLVAARRPSVSTALGELQREGTLERAPDGWILRGDPPPPAPRA
jgi:CRP-like cAMP-binding protein